MHRVTGVGLLLTLLWWSAAAPAAQLRFEAPVAASQWRTTGSQMHCTLEHEIPRFGIAVFSQRAGGGLTFYLRSERVLPLQMEAARVVVEPPAWNHYAVARSLGEVERGTPDQLFALGAGEALQLIMALEGGLFPVFRYQEGITRQRVDVALSAVRFQEVLPRFRQCVASLFPFGFEDVALSQIHFAFDRDELTSAGREVLDRVVTWLFLDPSVRFAIVEGHTDSRGASGYNEALSRRRAETVHAWLVKQGVSPERLELRYAGEQRPVADNRSDAGRARNRRVEIRLQR